MSKKNAVLLAMVGLLSIVCQMFVSANSETNQTQPEKVTKVEKKPIVLTPEQIWTKQLIVEKFELQEKAKKYGIDESKLTYNQLKEVVAAKEKEEMIEKAKMYSIDTKGLTDEQLGEKIATKINEQIFVKARIIGINTDGLNLEQVKAKIIQGEKDLPVKKAEQEKNFYLDEAKRFGINTTGLSFDKVKSEVNKKMMPLLIKKAKELGIEYSDLNYNQLLLNIKTKEYENSINTKNTKKK